MSTVLMSGSGGGAGSVGASSGSLWIKGDDDGLWYEASLTYDSVLGIYLWSVGGGASEYPRGSINISDRLIGSAFYMVDPAGSWHTFNMTATDIAVPGYVWTDADQSASVPVVRRMLPKMRADDGIYLSDMGGEQIHKLGVTGGLWSELSQGYSIPL